MSLRSNDSGYFFNDFLTSIMGFGLLLIITMLPLSVYSAYAHDLQSWADSPFGVVTD